MDFAEDLSVFVHVGGFAVAATVGGKSVNAIFEDGYAEAFGIDGSSPRLTCRAKIFR